MRVSYDAFLMREADRWWGADDGFEPDEDRIYYVRDLVADEQNNSDWYGDVSEGPMTFEEAMAYVEKTPRPAADRWLEAVADYDSAIDYQRNEYDEARKDAEE